MVELEAPIVEVAVFGDGARVVRRGRCRLDTGAQEVVVRNLPATLERDSVRVIARGAQVRLLDVQVRRGFSADAARDEELGVEADVELWRDELQALDDDVKAEEARLDFLGQLSPAAATSVAKAFARGQAGHDSLESMGQHIATETSAALGRKREIAVRRRSAQRLLDIAEARLTALQGSRQRREIQHHEVVAELEASSEGEVEVELSYHVTGSSWRPLYDLRLHDSRLEVGYLAEVTQRSGEDWPAVPVVLSTARPSASAELPDLKPWYVDRARPRSPRLRAGPVPGAPGGAPEAWPAPAAAQPGPPPPSLLTAEVLEAETVESGPAIAYRVARPLAVPSDGAPHKTTVAVLDLDARLDHYAVPKLAPEVHLRATVTNDSSLLLLPGPAQVFHDAELVGAARLGTVAPGEELEVHLGVDDRVRVERRLERRATSKAVLGGSRTVELAYEIDVDNHRDGPVQVSVHDQVPVSRDGDIKVRLREISPKPEQQTDLGELVWRLSLRPGDTVTARFVFTVEHPANVTVAGLGV